MIFCISRYIGVVFHALTVPHLMCGHFAIEGRGEVGLVRDDVRTAVDILSFSVVPVYVAGDLTEEAGYGISRFAGEGNLCTCALSRALGFQSRYGFR